MTCESWEMGSFMREESDVDPGNDRHPKSRGLSQAAEGRPLGADGKGKPGRLPGSGKRHHGGLASEGV